MCFCAQMCTHYKFCSVRTCLCMCVVEYLCRKTEEITNVREPGDEFAEATVAADVGWQTD